MTTQQDVVDVSIAGARPGWMIRCWGKTGSETAQFHPALFHMIDTGHVARALLQPPASPRWQGFLVRSFGQDARELSEWLPFAVALHDIGKVAIPAELLSKPTALSPEEMALIRTHADAGAPHPGAPRRHSPGAARPLGRRGLPFRPQRGFRDLAHESRRQRAPSAYPEP